MNQLAVPRSRPVAVNVCAWLYEEIPSEPSGIPAVALLRELLGGKASNTHCGNGELQGALGHRASERPIEILRRAGLLAGRPVDGDVAVRVAAGPGQGRRGGGADGVADLGHVGPHQVGGHGQGRVEMAHIRAAGAIVEGECAAGSGDKRGQATGRLPLYAAFGAVGDHATGSTLRHLGGGATRESSGDGRSRVKPLDVDGAARRRSGCIGGDGTPSDRNLAAAPHDAAKLRGGVLEEIRGCDVRRGRTARYGHRADGNGGRRGCAPKDADPADINGPLAEQSLQLGGRETVDVGAGPPAGSHRNRGEIADDVSALHHHGDGASH